MKTALENFRIYAVEARDITLEVQSFHNVSVILKNFNLTVPQGAIYGLLGPSGCGKTSFLKCVIGLFKHSSGSVQVFGCSPGDYESGVPGRGVGYMPQELALDCDLSICETLKYYGRLYYVSYEKIHEQTRYFIETLELPDPKTLVGELSQGQQRRVSYACAIIHSPRLLILDEPTVGVDPVLRIKIWEHLVWLSKSQSTTIIITTHYIEEAKRANIVGFMREGSLLVEDSPEALKSKVNCANLDEVFFKLCFDSKTDFKPEYREPEGLVRQKLPLTTNPTSTFHACTWLFLFWVLTKKLFIQIEKNPIQLFLKIILAVITLIACTSCVGPTPHGITVAIVNEEKPRNYSALYLDIISRYILVQKEFETMDEALEAVKKYEALSVIHIQSNFSAAIPAITFQQAVPSSKINFTVLQSKIKLHADLAQQPLFATVERVLEQTFLEFSQLLARKLGYNSLSGLLPISSGQPIYGRHIEGDYAGWKDFEASGISVAIVFSISFLVIAFSLQKDRNEKIFERNYAAGLTPSHLVLGHLVARFLFTIPFVISVFMFDVYICELPTEGSMFLTLVLLSLLSLGGMALGIMLSAIFDASEVLVYASNGAIIFLGVIGGLMWPKEALPYWVKWAADLSPLTLPTEAFRSILMRGWGFLHPTVFYAFSILSGWTLAIIAASVLVLELKK